MILSVSSREDLEWIFNIKFGRRSHFRVRVEEKVKRGVAESKFSRVLKRVTLLSGRVLYR